MESHPSQQRWCIPSTRHFVLVGGSVPRVLEPFADRVGADTEGQGVHSLPVTLSQGQMEDEQTVPTSWPLG